MNRKWISPFGLASALFASSGVVVASLVGLRWQTISLSLLGLVVGAWGLIAGRSRFSCGGSCILCIAVLLIALLAPTILNPFWASDSQANAADKNQYMVVPRLKPRSAERPLKADEWVDAKEERIRQDDLYIQLQSIMAGKLADKGATPYLIINLHIIQSRDGKSVKFERLAKHKHELKLTDASGHEYAFLEDRIRKSPSKFDRLFMADQLLLFELPTEVQSLMDKKIGEAIPFEMKLELPASSWGREGTCRFRITEILVDRPPDIAAEIAKTKLMLHQPTQILPDRALGRTRFSKNCQECHTLFGTGGKTGPDLTASKRNDLDFLLTSIIDPSAVIEPKYKPTIVHLASGEVLNGIIQKDDGSAITLQIPGRIRVVPKDEIEEMHESKISLMPAGLLNEFTDHDKRSLIAYLQGTQQAPMLATPENALHFFPPAEDLSNWHSTGPRWTIEKGVLSAPDVGAGKTAQLISDLHIDDEFHLTLRFNPGKEGRGAIVIADPGQPDFSKAIRIEFAAGGRNEVVGADGKISLNVPAKADSWNKLEIVLGGKFDSQGKVVVEKGCLQVKLNDSETATVSAAAFPTRRVIALQGSGDPNCDVRFKNIGIRLVGAKK